MTRTLANTSLKLKPFFFHGIDVAPLSKGSSEAKGDCPFCDREGYFFIKIETGQWSCKKCLEQGNTYGFLQLFHNECLRETTLDDYKELRAARPGIPISEMKDWQFAKNKLTDDWLIPMFNARDKDPTKRKLANLMKAFENEDGKWPVMSTPGCKLHLFGNHLANKNHDFNVVLEGAWDAPAFRAILKRLDFNAKQDTFESGSNAVYDFNVYGAPGAGTFNVEWLDIIKSKPTIFLFDNDHPQVKCLDCKKHTPLLNPDNTTKLMTKCIHCSSKKLSENQHKPGWDGMERIFNLMAKEDNAPPEVYRIKWGQNGHNPKLKDGFDVRDEINREKKKDKEEFPVAAVQYIWKRLEEVDITLSKEDGGEAADQDSIEPIECKDYKILCEAFDKHLCYTQTMSDTFVVMLATCLSTEISSDQIFLKVKGPPGSGKTTLAECVSAARKYVFAKSIFTGFFSGFGSQKKDYSMIKQILNKTFVVKDADTLISSPNLDTILAEIRDLWDGKSRSQYRTGTSHNYERIRTTMILCGTDELNNLNRSTLGDRFIDVDILGDEDTTPFLERAATTAYNDCVASLKFLAKRNASGDDELEEEDAGLHLQQLTAGFINYLKENLGSLIPKETTESKRDLKRIAQFLAYMRARVRRDKQELTHRQRVELGTRLTKQFTKLALCVAVVLSKPTIDKEVLRIMRKVTLDTAVGFPLEICRQLYARSNGLSSRQIAIDLGLGETTVRRYLFDMQELKITERGKQKNNSGVRGRDLHLWTLTPTVRTLYQIAHQTQKEKLS